MPIIKSAKKRVKVAAKASARNAKTKRNLRETIKALHSAIASGKSATINETHQKAARAIDLATKKNVIHKNKAARKKHQLSVAVKASGVKASPAKKVVDAKPVTKKSVAKKVVAKKPVAKKAPVKKAAKPVTKKASAKK